MSRYRYEGGDLCHDAALVNDRKSLPMFLLSSLGYLGRFSRLWYRSPTIPTRYCAGCVQGRKSSSRTWDTVFLSIRPVGQTTHHQRTWRQWARASLPDIPRALLQGRQVCVHHRGEGLDPHMSAYVWTVSVIGCSGSGVLHEGGLVGT